MERIAMCHVNVEEIVNNNPLLRFVHSRSAVGKVMTRAQAEKKMLETASLMVLNAKCTLILVTLTLTLTLTLNPNPKP
jgi:hypothetical protein